MGNKSVVASSGSHLNDLEEEKKCPVSHETMNTFSQVNQPSKGCTSEFINTTNTNNAHGYKVDSPQTPQSDGKLLSNIVISSTIPKGGTESETWQYPSPQRFFNAMKKKGYNPHSEDMQAVVSIHNTVNEKCWNEILEYEKFHYK